jgi:nucleoside 2-deoxyribosyltransferase
MPRVYRLVKMWSIGRLRIYKTDGPWDKKTGQPLETFIGHKKRNLYNSFEKRARRLIGIGSWRCFIIMPIQGEKFGSQDEQRVFKEYDNRFEALESLLGDYETVGIRIDKEHPLEDVVGRIVVGRIKEEIRRAHFVIADLTDERPSCYFEAGYSEALGRPTVYVASKESVLYPGQNTKIHFDIHMNVNFFTNNDELVDKIRAVLEKNKERLFKEHEEVEPLTAD